MEVRDNALESPISAQMQQVHAERIVAAACQVMVADAQDDPILTISIPAPARHHHIIHAIYALHGIRVAPRQQGFLTSTGRFVGREEALQIALTCGQPLIDHPSRHSTQLFSEDLW